MHEELEDSDLNDEPEEDAGLVYQEGKRYNKLELEEIANAILREDANRELCRQCKEEFKEKDPEYLPYGQETGYIEWQLQRDEDGTPALDADGNVMYVAYPELQCERGHRWYKGEGPRRDIRGPNPILFESHLYNRRRREIQCVDAITQCLTQELGWTSHEQLRPGMHILAFNPDTQATQWEEVQRIHVTDEYQGQMIRLKGIGFDVLTTPNHRWPIYTVPRTTIDGQRVRNHEEARIEVLTTEQLPHHSYRAILLGAPYGETPTMATYSDEFVELIGWIFTEGHIWGSVDGPRIAITQSPIANPENVRAIRNVLDALDVTHSNFKPGSNAGSTGFKRRQGLYCRTHTLPNEGLQFTLFGSGVDEILRVIDRNKQISMKFLCALTHDQLELLIDTLIAGDGTTGTNIFHQRNALRMEVACQIFVLAGYAPSLHDQGSQDGTMVTIDGHTWQYPENYGYNGNCTIRGRSSRKPRRWLHRLKDREVIDYTGTVWCPVTESGHWVARRDKTFFITGNTEEGTPDPAYTMDRWGKRPTQGLYIRVHPQGRKVNSDEARKNSGAAFYR
jgi:hypothetical protein